MGATGLRPATRSRAVATARTSSRGSSTSARSGSRSDRSRSAAQAGQLRLHEEPDELAERHGRRPAEPLARARRIADEVVELRLPASQRLVDVHVLAPVEADVLER